MPSSRRRSWGSGFHGYLGLVPILMYHSVSGEQDRRSIPYYQTNTYPSVFEEHIRFLVADGYKPCWLEDIFNNGLKGFCGKPIAITFDDGYQDIYSIVYPILRKFNIPATVFLPTGYIGSSRMSFKDRPCLDWNEIRELSKNGFSFGSHSHSHLELNSLTLRQLEEELRASKEIIEREIGTPVRSFSYPYAFPEADEEFVRLLRSTLAKTGYRTGVTTKIGCCGPGADPLTLKRIPINSHDDITFFKAKIEGCYDWVYSLQRIYKVFGRKLRS